MNPIINDFQKTVRKALERYAVQLSTNVTNVQLLLALKSPDENIYAILKNYEPIVLKDKKGTPREMSFNDILGVKIDFTGKSAIVPPFIRQIIEQLSSENKIELTKARAIIYLQGEKVNIYLYNSDNPVKPIELEQLFGG